MKGLILAGGFGNRLKPLTDVINKHLLPVYNRPMIYYPLQTLLKAGVRDILIVTGPDYSGGFMKFLGSGERFGARFYFAVQENAGGIAQAVSLAETFAANDPLAVILGDNLFEDDFGNAVRDFSAGATVFLKKVSDPQRFGVPELQGNRVVRIEEKPSHPKSPYAVTGFYLYDSSVFDIVRTLKPSDRGELEITDVNNAYVDRKAMQAVMLEGDWTDAGTFESLFEANRIAREIALKDPEQHD